MDKLRRSRSITSERQRDRRKFARIKDDFYVTRELDRGIGCRSRRKGGVSDLRREDFRVYDQGKLQEITKFSAETPKTRKQRALTAQRTQVEKTNAESTQNIAPPDHFVAILFEDTHMTQQELAFARGSAIQFITLFPT